MSAALAPAELEAAFPAVDSAGSQPLARIFGVRHLSPAGAAHLHTVLDVLRPTAVLVEGPSDATEHLKHLVHKDARPPVALLAYTQDRPVRSILYPLASYSPEWVALTWGLRNKAEVRFIDLPAAVFLQLHHTEPEEHPGHITPEEGEAERPPPTPPHTAASEHTLAYLDDPWEEIARLSGDPDHETWWERHFEHTTDPISYIRQIYEFGLGLRSLRKMKPDDDNLVREAHMRLCIHNVLDQGHKAEKVLIVCGAFHSPALTAALPPMTDKEYKALPRAKSSLTLMPYSYYRLSSQSGYGAGNHAPSYFQRLYDDRLSGHPERLPAYFMTELCHALRKSGQMRSAAEVIEAVRLAHTLAAMSDSPAPCLRDLRDAALTCLGRGELEVIRPALQPLEIGHEVGQLPKGVSRTAIQDDFYLTTENLALEKYLADKDETLTLDLREDRHARTEETAYRDLNRSTFFHRLLTLDIHFADKQRSKQEGATWKEIWKLRWRPDNEIQLAEGSLLGDSVEMAAAVRLSQRLAECQQIDAAAKIVEDSVVCRLADALENARRRLQAMAVAETSFVQLAGAIASLANVVRYGSVRKFDPDPLKPLLSQLFLRSCFALRDACHCDDAAAREQIQPAIIKLSDVAENLSELVDGARWNRELDVIATTDSLNPYLSGFVLGMVLRRTSEETLAREVSRRLSRGVPPDLGGAWFEGLLKCNPEDLLSRLSVWRQIDSYVQGLDDQEFRHALVPLRRAFGSFEPRQVQRIVHNLIEISDTGARELQKNVDVKLSDEEAKKLQEELGDLGI